MGKLTCVVLLLLWTAVFVNSKNDSLDPAPGRSPGPPTQNQQQQQTQEQQQQLRQQHECTTNTNYIWDNESLVNVNNDEVGSSSSSSSNSNSGGVLLDVIHDVFDTTNEPLVPELTYKGKRETHTQIHKLYSIHVVCMCLHTIDFFSSSSLSLRVMYDVRT